MGFWNSKLLIHTRIFVLNIENEIIYQPRVLKLQRFDVTENSSVENKLFPY